MSNDIIKRLSRFGDNEWDILNYEFFRNFDSPHTRKCYERDIGLFFSFMDSKEVKLIGPQDILKIHVIAYRNYLQDLEQAPKTICRKLSSISSYFDFLIEKNLIDINPCHGVKRPRQVVINETQDLSDKIGRAHV